MDTILYSSKEAADRDAFVQLLKTKGINNPSLTPTMLRVKVPLENGNNMYTLKLKNKGITLPGERLLESQDFFYPTGISYAFNVADGNFAVETSSFPDPGLFSAAVVKSLKAFFFGAASLKMKDGSTTILEAIDAKALWKVPQRPYTTAAAAGFTAPVSQETGMCGCDCALTLHTEFMISGAGEPTIEIFAGTGKDITSLKGVAPALTEMWVEVCGWYSSGNMAADCPTTSTVLGLSKVR